MKVIFLDHDGVICLATEWGGRFKKQREAGRKLSQSVASLPVLSRFDNFNCLYYLDNIIVLDFSFEYRAQDTSS